MEKTLNFWFGSRTVKNWCGIQNGLSGVRGFHRWYKSRGKLNQSEMPIWIVFSISGRFSSQATRIFVWNKNQNKEEVAPLRMLRGKHWRRLIAWGFSELGYGKNCESVKGNFSKLLELFQKFLRKLSQKYLIHISDLGEFWDRVDLAARFWLGPGKSSQALYEFIIFQADEGSFKPIWGYPG